MDYHDLITRLHPHESNGTLLVLDSETEAFFKAETRIQGTQELRKHIIEVQEEAHKICPYFCVRGFTFVRLKMARSPTYSRALQLLKDRPDAILLDIGCCMGVDLRKIIQDGWPISQTIGTDLQPAFWDLGHKLFRTTPETYPVKFLAGSALDDAQFCPTAPIPPHPLPSVASVKTLTELRGHFSVIYAGSLFDVLGEGEQVELGKRLAALLDPRPGSIIFGSHTGAPSGGQRNEMFPKIPCHSPESWIQIWEEQFFQKGEVKVTANAVEMDMAADIFGVTGRKVAGEVEGAAKYHMLVWSVERQ